MSAGRGRPRNTERLVAKSEGRTRYFTGKACANGHVAERRVKDGECVECWRAYRRRHAHTEAGKIRIKRQKQKRKQRFLRMGLTAKGTVRKKGFGVSVEEKRERERVKRRKYRIALRVLEDLGIEI